MNPPPSIHIQLIHNSSVGPIERVLVERESLRLGRQVKAPEETQKIFFQLSTTEHIASQTTKDTNTTIVSPVWFTSKVVSRIHAELWLRAGQVYLKDVGSSSGTFLNKLRLSPANRRSRPYPLRHLDVIQLGVDYQGRTEDMYRCVELTVHIFSCPDVRALQLQTPIRFTAALIALQNASLPQNDITSEEDKSLCCCICLCDLGAFQALFIAPCAHSFHYKCIKSVLLQSMFPCPVCRQVANLDASVSMESLVDVDNIERHMDIDYFNENGKTLKNVGLITNDGLDVVCDDDLSDALDDALDDAIDDALEDEEE